MVLELQLLFLLVSVFVIGTRFNINIGLVALVAAYFAATVLMDLDDKAILAGFPTSLFIMIMGIMMLMTIANMNGAVDWLVARIVSATGGNMAILPWMLFFVGAAVSSFGVAAAPILFVIGLSFAVRYHMNPLLMGAMALHGNQCGFFSPIAPYGLLFSDLAERAGYSVDSFKLYIAVLVGHFILALIVFFIFGGAKLFKQRVSSDVIAQTVKDAGELSTERVVTLLGLASLLLGVVLFQLNVGFWAICISFCLLFFCSEDTKDKIVGAVPWSIVLIIVGVLIFVGVLQEAELFKWLADQAGLVGSPVVVALLMCFLAAAVTAVSSTFGTFSILIPLSAPFIINGDLSAVGLIAAIGISAAVTDISPYSPWGALFLGSSTEVNKNLLMKDMLRYVLALIILVPLVTWALFVLPGF